MPGRSSDLGKWVKFVCNASNQMQKLCEETFETYENDVVLGTVSIRSTNVKSIGVHRLNDANVIAAVEKL